MPKIKTLLHTLSYLKPIQAVYQVKNRLLPKKPLKAYDIEEKQTNALSFFRLMPHDEQLKVEPDGYLFHFLNLKKKYGFQVDWNDQSHGKLWNYNLQYLDFLKQDNISVEIKVELIRDIYSWLWTGKIPLEPYPVSLRIMNVIRFLSCQDTPDASVQKWVNAETHYLSKNLEYHLLGNHLLENGFAILMAGYYFKHRPWIRLAEKLLKAELKEQILEDGAHFELSPMYHQIILLRVLEAINYLPKGHTFLLFLQEVSRKMMAWLDTMTFRSGNIPHFNDSTDGIAFTTAQLTKMGADLGLLRSSAFHSLTTSGYRKLQNRKVELIADVHGISPSYQPGHAHADSLSFVMEVDGKPCVVDMGISTYQISPRRDYERSTKAHNTVTINDQDTAEVWSGFRVGRRPSVDLLKADDREIQARLSYNGFIHKRTFLLNTHSLSILDEVNTNSEAKARLYFHPTVRIASISDDTVVLSNNLSIKLENNHSVKAFDYLYNQGYNLQIPGQFIEIGFTGQCRKQFILQD